ncbi:MAG: DUF1684 domain-containing protein [Acidobacteriota bacterium]|nr:DUF1684 domain-containing protein [Acidobacteriota bacterium]
MLPPQHGSRGDRRRGADATIGLWVSAIVTLCGCGGDPSAVFDEASFLAELDTWRQERDAGLRRDDGWLSLAGLFWLEEGPNRFGANIDNDLVFPPGSAPPVLGHFLVAGDGVRVRTAPGVELRVSGEPAMEAAVASDADGDPTMIEHGSLLFYVISRNERLGVRLKDRSSPLLAGFEGMHHYAPAPAWRITGEFQPYDPPKIIPVPNILGTPVDETCPGRVVFEVVGETYTLEPTGEPGEELFIVFGDETNGEHTYGGGRFLRAAWPADGEVVLDFNRAYNPPCVFTPWATCPLPPPQNRLSLSITAGELAYGSDDHS